MRRIVGRLARAVRLALLLSASLSYALAQSNAGAEMPSPPGFFSEPKGANGASAASTAASTLPRPGTPRAMLALGIASSAAMRASTWSVDELLALPSTFPTLEKRSVEAVNIQSSAALARIFDRFEKDHTGRIPAAVWKPLIRNPRDSFAHVNKDGSVDRAGFAKDFLHINSFAPSDRRLFTDRDLRECQGLFANGYFERALEQSRKTVRSYPEIAETWVALAIGLEAAGRVSECRKAYARALELDPDNEDALVGLAMFKDHDGKPLEARRALDRALDALDGQLAVSHHPIKGSSDEERAENLLHLLLNYFLRFSRRPEIVQTLTSWGTARLGRQAWLKTAELEAWALGGERDAAEAEVGRLAKSGFAPAQMYRLWGKFMLEDGRLLEAEQYLRQALRSPAPESEKMEARLDLYTTLAKGGYFDSANELLMSHIMPETSTPASRRNLARCLAAAGHVDLALKQVRYVVEASPCDPMAWVDLADLLGRKRDYGRRQLALMEALARCKERTTLAQRLRQLTGQQEAPGGPGGQGQPREDSLMQGLEQMLGDKFTRQMEDAVRKSVQQNTPEMLKCRELFIEDLATSLGISAGKVRDMLPEIDGGNADMRSVPIDRRLFMMYGMDGIRKLQAAGEKRAACAKPFQDEIVKEVAAVSGLPVTQIAAIVPWAFGPGGGPPPGGQPGPGPGGTQAGPQPTAESPGPSGEGPLQLPHSIVDREGPGDFVSRLLESPIRVCTGTVRPGITDQVLVPLMVANRDKFKGKAVLDIGTGTGILALCAAQLGATKVVATDIDPRAITCARDNARRLSLESVIETRLVSLSDPSAYSVIRPGEVFDVVVGAPPAEANRVPFVISGKLDNGLTDDDDVRLGMSIIAGLREHLARDGAAMLLYPSSVLQSTLVGYARHLGFVVEFHPALQMQPPDWFALYNTFAARVAHTEHLDPAALLVPRSDYDLSNPENGHYVQVDWGEEGLEFPPLWAQKHSKVSPGMIVIRKRPQQGG